MIFDEIRGHILILLYYRAQQSLGKYSSENGKKIEVKVLDMPNANFAEYVQYNEFKSKEI